MSPRVAAHPLTRALWKLAALGSLALGLVGVVLPGLPTVPFILLASWCALRGSPGLHRWLVSHPRFGPLIVEWETHGAVSRRAKWMALGMMLLASVIMALSPAPLWAWAVASGVMLVVGIWLWRRPEPPAARTRP